jgi:tRNA(Leu) C34 or U34 (ribose-2'-O)-methylase TrmL
VAKKKPGGVTPAVILFNPKYAYNVGAALRAASCFGVQQLWYTGDRIDGDLALRNRLPREERMKGYQDVNLCGCDYPFERFKDGVTFVAVELLPQSECLTFFDHPEDVVYVFGPEDGGLTQVVRKQCHRFITIPSAHCLNLAAAVNVVLYDRRAKRQLAGLDPAGPQDFLAEHRGCL